MNDKKQGWSADQSIWNDRAKTAGIVAAAGMLAWWGWSSLSESATAKNEQRRERSQRNDASNTARARQLLHEGPITNAWKTSQGTVVQIEIPVDRYKTGDVDFQRCYVWRDAVTPSVAMHCDPEPVPDVGTTARP